MTGPLRFFRVVDAPPVWMRVATMTVVAYSVVVVWMDPQGSDSALAALLLWQMLSASRGFAKPAAAGHFDPVLIREGRLVIAGAHLVHAAAPMLAAWLLVAAIEFAVGGSLPRAIEPGRLAALLFVSAAVWALSLGAAPMVTGALWVAGLAGLAVTPLGLQAYSALFERPEGIAQQLHAVALAMVCPFLMIDVVLPMRAGVTWGLFGGSIVAAALGTLFIARRSYPLEPAL